MPPQISVVIPNYNGSELILRCLNSVANQEFNYEIEIIVIDDGSTDASPNIVRSFLKSIKLIQQENKGPAAARNRGIDAAVGKYIAFLDADDYWDPRFLNSTVKFLEDHQEAVAVSVGQLHKIPGKPDIVIPVILKNNPGKYPQPVILDDFFEFWAEHNHVCTGSVLMRTDIVKRTGGQRPDLRITEDLEFWAYLATFGKWGFIPKVLFVSDGGAVTKQRGWLEKNKRRWASAPTPEEWERRTIARINPLDMSSFEKVRGRIARNLSYSMIMSGKSALAKQTVNTYYKAFPDDLMSTVFRISSKNFVFWFMLTSLLRFKELTRSVHYGWFQRRYGK